MKCGKCKQSHDTVAEVKACYGVKQEYVNPVGDDTILKMPKSAAPAQVKKASERYDAIPEGYYATPSLTGHNDLDFWRVDKPAEGKWAGYIFVKRVIGGRPSVNVKGSTKFQALDAILAAGPEQAMALYGQTLGYCGRCGRHLTDEESRAYGIGPVCRAA
jgi:hypothetical protein